MPASSAAIPSLRMPLWMRRRNGALNRRRWKALESSISSSSRGNRAWPRRRNGMTIGKKLYVNFGIILTMVVVLFLVNWFAVQREHAAKAAAASSLELADATNAVRFQMMQNRLYLSNYLLSGDTREVERMNDGARVLEDKLRMAESLAESDQQRSAIQKVQQTEQNWARDFATPLEEKRKEVDSGNATVAELQIFYLTQDASSWVNVASEYLNAADRDTRYV